jgi:hypothetical protein
MAYNANTAPLLRQNIIGFYGDATARVDSVKYAYSYVTADAAATVEVGNYFDAVTDLRRGDQIQATMAIGGTPVFKNYVVLTGIGSGDAHNTIGLATGTAG